MAEKDCIDPIHEALKGKASKAQITRWVDAISKEFKKNGGGSQQDLINKSVELGRKKLREAYLKRRNTALIIDKQLQIQDYVLTNYKDKPDKGIMAMMGGIQSYKGGSRLSAGIMQEQLRHAYLNNLLMDLQKDNLWEVFSSGEYDLDVMKELFDVSQKAPTGKATNNGTAKSIAAIVRKHQESARLRANRAGADIGELDGYITTQTHDAYKIYGAGKQAWLDSIRGKLDIKRTFPNAESDAEVATYLEGIYKTLATGRQFIVDTSEPLLSSLENKANIGGSLSSQRVLHFKDAESYFNYNKEFGTGSLRENLVNQFTKLANTTGLMEVFGPNPKEAIERAITNIGATLDVKEAKRLADSQASFDKLYSVLDGSTNIPGNPTAAKWGNNVRGVQTMAKLGGALISALIDTVQHASELRYQGDGFLDGIHSGLLGKFNNVPKERRVELAQMLGTFIDSQIHDMTERFSGRENISGKMSKATATFFKWSGLQWWTNRGRINIGLAMSSRLGSLAGSSFASIDPDLKRVLGLFNIGEKDWGIIGKSIEMEEGKSFVVPTRIKDVPDADFKSAYGDNVDIARAKEDLENRLRSYFIDRSEHGVIQPDARTIAWMKQGTRPGTVDGEFMRSVMQFKAFPITSMYKSLGREIYGREKFDKSSFMGLAQLVVGMTTFGYISMALKDIIKGREPRDPRDWKTMQAAMLQGGAMGLLGDFILGQSNRFGGGFLASAMGPTAAEIENLVKLLHSVRDGDDPSAKGLKLLTGNMPFMNLFYIKTALDYAILYNMQEAMNPGYLSRMESRIKRENNQEFLVKPSSIVPHGGNF